MPKASPTPPVKEALEEMGKAEDEVRFFLRQKTILLASTLTETNTRHLLSTPPPSTSTGLRATSESISESLQRYMDKSHEMGHIIKEEGWDNASWPELHDKNLQDAREKLRDEGERAIIILDYIANIQERWDEFEGNSPPVQAYRCAG